MAHFAYVKDGIVQRVEVVVNEVIATPEGGESESIGKAFMVSLYSETVENEWIQCSYNANFRGKYPGMGDIFDEVLDEFVSPELIEIPFVLTDAETLP